jgi:xylan 1,4-beta-xylosidase
MNMGAQLKDIARAFEAINSFPELKDIPIIIGECDPEGCAACSEKRDPKYGYRNGTMYSSYTAASFARIYELMDRYKVNLRGAVSWSFEFEDQEWFAGFRDLATHGVDKPVLNVFRMFGLMEGKRIAVQTANGVNVDDIIANGVTKQNDIHAIASTKDHSVWIMVWNYHDDNVAGESSAVELTVDGVTASQVMVHHYRVDQRFSNAFEKWKAKGSPQTVTPEDFRELESAGQLQLYTSPQWLDVSHEKAKLTFDLPRQGVSMVQLSWR